MIGLVEKDPKARPRSVVPGRQRWDIGLLLGRPDVAERLETALLSSPGIEGVRANPVTGRLLVFHDATLTSDGAGQRIRQTAALIARRAVAIVPRSSSRKSSPTPTPHPRLLPRGSRLLVGGTAAAAVVLLAPLVSSPAVKLGIVLGATAIILRRAWRRSSRFAAPGTPERPRKALQTIVGPQKPQFYLATFLSATGAVLYMAAAACAFSLASVLITGPSATLAGLGVATLSGQVWLLGISGLLACAMFAGVWFVGGVTWRNLAQRVQHEWRCDMYEHVQKAELGFLEGERTTRVARVLTEDIDQFGRFLGNQANYLVRVATTLGLLTLVFVVFAPEIAWLAFLPVPIVAWLSFYYQESVAPRLAVVGKEAALLNSQLINNLEASATIKSFGAEDFEVQRIRRLSETYGKSTHEVDVRTTAYGQGVLGLSMMGLVGVYLLGGNLVLAGVLLLGAYNTVIRLPQLLNFQLPGLGEAVEQYQKTLAALGRVLHLRDLPIEVSGSGRTLDMTTVGGEMVLEGVTFAYPGRAPVLRNLSLRFEARKTTAVVGATGAGKTTIAKILLRLQDAASGRVLLDGVDIRELRLNDLRAAIAFVGQEAFLFDGTIGENISYGTFDAGAEQILAAARLAEADSFIETLPSRYETKVGERGVSLSGGQRQRISLARAIVKNAPILILDEATSAVDNETEAAIQHALADFARGRTMVIIAHRLSTIRHADWIYVIGENGALVEEGTHSELLGNANLYSRLWRLQIGDARPGA